MDEPIYIILGKSLENDIIEGRAREGGAIPSTNELSERFGINPATVVKGVDLLAREGFLRKRRGVGVFVVEGARELIIERRIEEFRERVLPDTLREARMLGIPKSDLVAMVMSR